jgi:2-octaprenyl-6-methoxyphenol hydroxylase
MSKYQAAAIGAGPTGLAAALALAHMGVEVAVIAPGSRASGSDPVAPPSDQRTTALMVPSINLLKNLGVLEAAAIESDAQGLTPMTAVRIADDRGGIVRAPEVVFRAAELGFASFGANIANPTLLAGLRSAAERHPGIAWVETGGVMGLAPAAASVVLELAEGGTLEAALAVAADGRNSTVRAAAGIEVDAWAYPQAAIATSFGHSRPHEGIVNELHRPAGPLTTVPLPGRRSALVWVEQSEQADRLAGLDDLAFTAVLEDRLQGVLGSIGEVTPRAVHRLSGLRARRMTGVRVALVGEAAHVMPPIGAQGLNLGLRDAAQLADCAVEARARGEDLGGRAMLAAYERARAWDVLGRSVAIDLLNRSLIADLLPVDMLRGLAAHLVTGLGPLRRLVMREGLGVAGPLPSLMRT